MYVCILFLILFSIMFHHKELDIVPCATQKDLITHPSKSQRFFFYLLSNLLGWYSHRHSQAFFCALRWSLSSCHLSVIFCTLRGATPLHKQASQPTGHTHCRQPSLIYPSVLLDTAYLRTLAVRAGKLWELKIKML